MEEEEEEEEEEEDKEEEGLYVRLETRKETWALFGNWHSPFIALPNTGVTVTPLRERHGIKPCTKPIPKDPPHPPFKKAVPKLFPEGEPNWT